MSIVYAESSAVLRWLLGASDGPALRTALAKATRVVTSTLTSAEVGRTLRRLVATGALDPAGSARAWARYSAAVAHWQLYAVTDAVLIRARDAYPVEPIRTLDAIHLATAELYSQQVATVRVLSVDARVRDNAVGLGLRVVP